MEQGLTIGIIGGNGWLGHALASSALAAGLVRTQSLTLSRRSTKRGATELPGVHWTTWSTRRSLL
jgi:hypothetical protein